MGAVALLFLILFASPALANDGTSPTTAEFCGNCHRAIFEGWKQSAHAQAMESRLFQDALEMVESDYGSQARKTCLGCHSPLAVQLGDLDLVRKTSWEGITCDYCHSIRQVVTSGTNPRAVVDFSNVKSGPSKESASPVHGTVFSPVHVSSVACISCHEYRNALGFPVLTTYSEWKNSLYPAEGQECQTCHMYTVRGDIVDPRIKKATQEGVNLHQMPGSRSLDQLNRAIQMQFSTERVGPEIKVTVKLTNRGAGHYVPTGSPLRQLILDVRVDPFGGETLRAERTYHRSVADPAGNPVKLEQVAFIRAAKVIEDTRLAPKETRTEVFSFKVPPRRQARVQASLSYYYSPMARSEAEQKIKFLTLSRLVQ